MVKTMGGIKLEKTQFTEDDVLKDFVNTKEVTDKIDKFVSAIPKYKKYGIFPKRGVLLHGPAGCHAKGTDILMFDGSIKKVEDVVVGDLLMGPDSSPREVLQLARNRQTMVRIIPNKGDSFVVNLDHILHLTPSGEAKTKTPINMTVRDYLSQTECFRETYKLTRTGVEFEKKDLPIDPYTLGLWLGDGNSDSIALTTADKEIEDIWIAFAIENNMDIKEYRQQINSRCKTIKLSSFEKTIGKNTVLNEFKELELINNKHIPRIYLTSNREDRLNLLAGLIDTDGTTGHSDLAISKGKFGTGYSYVSKSERLADDVIYLSRSLGFAAYKSKHTKGCYVGKKRVFEGDYFYVSISGDLSEVPVKLDRKKCKERVMNKSVLRTGFYVEILEEDDYYGFSLNKDHLYLTGDFTIHHNTGKTTIIAESARKYGASANTFILIWHTDKIEAGDVKDFIKHLKYNENIDQMILIAEDIGGIEIDQARIRSESALLSLLDNQEQTFKVPTLILATTNYPENFMGNLTNRPNRFDDKIRVGFPKAEQRATLLKFYDKEGLVDEEATSLISSKKCDEFTPAHLREAIIRSAIYDMPVANVIKDMVKEIEDFKRAFEVKAKSGVGLRNDDHDW
jgi:SpoVK/Ycf46/Vps4 family AAA+-type ATPase